MAEIVINNIVRPLLPYIITPNIKTDLIDPLTVIIKLAILYYKPIGTKISIGNNKISIQCPGFVQSSIRTIHGDNKLDLNMLQLPITFACSYYLQQLSRFQYSWLFELAIKGLNVLKTTYASDDITYTISRLVQIIQSHLDPTPRGTREEHSSDIDMKHAIFRNLGVVWDADAHQIITLLFNKIEASADMEQKRCYYLKSLEEYLHATEEDFNAIYVCIFKKH